MATTECEAWAAFSYAVLWLALGWFFTNLAVTLTWYRPWKKINDNIERMVYLSNGLVSYYMIESVFGFNFRNAEITWEALLTDFTFHDKSSERLVDTLARRGVKLKGESNLEKYEELKVVMGEGKNAPRNQVVFHPAITRDIFVKQRSWIRRKLSSY